MPSTVGIVSDVIGWAYTIAWSASFYPQVWLNWKRKSIVGFSLNYLCLNWTGFAAYAAYNVTLFWSPTVQAQYHEHHHGSIPVVYNDIAFSLHALLLTTIMVWQACVYDRGTQKVHRVVWACTAGIYGTVVVVLCVHFADKSAVNWWFFINVLGFLKMGISFAKYVPQVYINYRLKSTVGWHIGNVLLDLSGGMLSFLQQIILSIHKDNWSQLTGNVPKLGLALVSIFFDVLFMVQHYWLYRDARFKFDELEEPVAERSRHGKKQQRVGSQPLGDAV